MSKEKAPVKYYEIIDRKGSGFVLKGTEGTPYEQELTAPTVQWIAASGKALDPDVQGGFKEVRWINGSNDIDPTVQEKKGLKPNRFEDKIPMHNGFATIEKSGNTIGLYDYFESVFYNQDAPGRPSGLAARFREVKVNKRAENLLDAEELSVQAKSLIFELRQNTGKKDAPYRYDDDRINAMCRLVGVWDESPETKLVLLMRKAIENPKDFVNIVLKAEQTVITEVSHALELGVILFDGNTARFTDEEKVIKTVGNGNIKQEVKIEKLASWLSTEEGNSILTDLRAKVEVAKDKLLK